MQFGTIIKVSNVTVGETFMLKRLKEIRRKKGVTQIKAADDLGVRISTYRTWEQCKNLPNGQGLALLSDYYQCSIDTLMGREVLPQGAIFPFPIGVVSVPAFGRISADEPVEMVEAIDFIEIPITKRDSYPYAYFLIVFGDSMNNEVLNGSYALIDPRADVRNGDTVAVNINGQDATLKIWHRTNNTIVLSPNSTNPEHKDIVINEASPEAEHLRILGKKVWAMYPEK